MAIAARGLPTWTFFVVKVWQKFYTLGALLA